METDVKRECFIHNDNDGQAKKEQNASIINIFIIQAREQTRDEITKCETAHSFIFQTLKQQLQVKCWISPNNVATLNYLFRRK